VENLKNLETNSMKIDIDHILFWMDAIRNSKDRYRTLESFWKGQIKSKIWLIDHLTEYVNSNENNIVIHGGWNGVLSSLIFQSQIKVKNLISIDIDPDCEEIANTINKIEEMEGRFTAVTCDMSDYNYSFYPDIVINTSCEHISQQTYEKWLSKIPDSSIIVLQSNNYFELTEHIRCANDVNEFIDQSKINILNSYTLKLSKYDRFMIIGTKLK
jgi:phospholipid N-methyltransferase